MTWTIEAKTAAINELLAIASSYELLPAKKLYRRIRFYDNGRAQLVGEAHDYSYWLS